MIIRILLGQSRRVAHAVLQVGGARRCRPAPGDQITRLIAGQPTLGQRRKVEHGHHDR